MGRQSGYLEHRERLEPPPDPTTRLAEALLGSTISKRRQILTIAFDDLRDSNTVHKVLRGLQDNFEAPRK
jgi:hypothetical protein